MCDHTVTWSGGFSCPDSHVSSTYYRKQLDMDNKQNAGDGGVGKKLSNAVKNALQPTMTDPHRLHQRQKQIDMGKNTLGYEMFTKYVSR